MLPQLEPKPVNADDANPDPRPQSEDDGNYGSPAEFGSTANIAENGPDSTRDTSDKSARRRGKRPISTAY